MVTKEPLVGHKLLKPKQNQEFGEKEDLRSLGLFVFCLCSCLSLIVFVLVFVFAGVVNWAIRRVRTWVPWFLSLP